MKKIVRTVWIGALSGLAFMTACCTTKGLSRQERKQLIKERDSIQEMLTRREGAAVYGSPEIIAEYGMETLRLRSRLDSINYKLGENVDLEKSARRIELQGRLNQVRSELRRREGACVYGSPEVMEEWGRETRRLREEADSLQQQINDLDKPKGQKGNDGDVEVLYGSSVPKDLDLPKGGKINNGATMTLYGSPVPNQGE